MGYYDKDVYYDPADFGLTIIGSLDDPQASWSFDMLVVWEHEDGRLFYGQDSGCSCPSPFEDHHSLDDLMEITNDSWNVFQEAVNSHCNYSDSEYYGNKDELAADRTDLLRLVASKLPTN